jgi:hypothetical protein
MKVFYENKITTNDVFSLDTSPLSSLDNLFHRFLDFPVEFISNSSAVIEITKTIALTKIILAITNATQINITLSRSGSDIAVYTITEIKPIMRIMFSETAIDSAKIELLNSSDGGLLSLGAVYFGDAVTLPRFIVEPELGKEFLTESKRTFGGYTYGLDGEELRTISLEFRRINELDYHIVNKYLKKVGKTIPHFIDIYEEANEAWPIMYGTFSGDFKPVKRAENGFYFDFSLEYQEAK